MTNKIEDKHIFWIDHLKGIAIITVVLLHVAAPVLPFYGGTGSDWWISNLFDSAMRFCVPAFLMITGVLMLGREIQLKPFFNKRFLRIVFPFLFWNSIYVIYNYITGYIPVNLYMIKWVADKFLHGASFHLWYIYLIIGIYLFIPVINKWVSNSKLHDLPFFISIWSFILIMNLPYLKPYMPSVELSYFGGYLGYVILGYYLFKRNFRIGFYQALFMFVGGVLLTALGTYYMTEKTGEFNTALYAYLTPNVALASIGMFLMLQKSNIPNTFTRKILSELSKHSLGIYLIHILIFKLLGLSGIPWHTLGMGPGILIQAVLCIALSYLLIRIIRMVPYGKYVSG